jgi:hypothetical protein
LHSLASGEVQHVFFRGTTAAQMPSEASRGLCRHTNLQLTGLKHFFGLISIFELMSNIKEGQCLIRRVIDDAWEDPMICPTKRMSLPSNLEKVFLKYPSNIARAFGAFVLPESIYWPKDSHPKVWDRPVVGVHVLIVIFGYNAVLQYFCDTLREETLPEICVMVVNTDEVRSRSNHSNHWISDPGHARLLAHINCMHCRKHKWLAKA